MDVNLRTVLVVEDEPLIRLTLLEELEDAGFQVLEAGTAEDAMVVITDQIIHLRFTSRCQASFQVSTMLMWSRIVFRRPAQSFLHTG